MQKHYFVSNSYTNYKSIFDIITDQQSQEELSDENENQDQQEAKQSTNKQKTKQEEIVNPHDNIDFTKSFNSFYSLSFNNNCLDNTCCVCGTRAYDQRLYTCKYCGQSLCSSYCAGRHAEKCKKYMGQ